MSVRRLMTGALIAATSLWFGVALGEDKTALQPAQESQSAPVLLIPRQTQPARPEPPLASKPQGESSEPQGGTSTSEIAPQVRASGEEAQSPPSNAQNRPDPLAPVNHKVLDLNAKVDDHAFHPVASRWAAVVPRPARDCIHRFFENTGVVPRFANALLQLKLKQAGGELARFGINTTVGVAGLFDPADKWFGLKEHDDDFGQTLATYGMSGGLFVIVPLAGPVNVRDAIGGFVDEAMNPMNYLVPAAATVSIYKAGAHAIEGLNKRSADLDKFEGVTPSSPDLYRAVQSKYLEEQKQKELAARTGE
jgi:phospholipid-binding lipoprotein MlaA